MLYNFTIFKTICNCLIALSLYNAWSLQDISDVDFFFPFLLSCVWFGVFLLMGGREGDQLYLRSYLFVSLATAC